MRNSICEKYYGVIINGLTFIEPMEMTDSTGHIFWKIKCVCGNIFERIPGIILDGRVQSCGCISNNLRSKSLGGTGTPYENSLVSEQIRHMSAYSNWRINVFKSFGFLENMTNSSLEIHHIIPLSVLIKRYNINKDNAEEFKDVLFDVSNGIVMNEEIHAEFHALYGSNTDYYDLLTFNGILQGIS